MPDHLETIQNDAGDREDWYVIYREYYDGHHDTQLTDRQREYLQLKKGEEFRANYCCIVADSLAERLRVTGFAAGESENAGGETAQGAAFWKWWKASRMDNTQGIVHLATIRDGDAYLLVEWDNEEEQPRFVFEPAFDGTEGVKCHYSSDQRGRVLYATKRWTNDSGQQRVNFYFPDRIEKYYREAAGEGTAAGDWQPYDDGQGSTQRWLSAGARPLGVPVVHFKNKDEGYNFGASELRDAVPMQNALNKAIIDLVAAADTTAFRIYTMIGDDPTSLEVVPGSWVYTTKPPSGEDGAAIDYIPGEDLSNLIQFKDALAIEIARISRTPVSYFQISAQRAAEGTLKQEESGLVSKAQKCMVGFGDCWEDAMRIARRLWNTFGDGAEDRGDIGYLDEDVDINTVWADPETRNIRSKMEWLTVLAKVLRVPRTKLWALADFSPEEIEEMKNDPEYELTLKSMMLALEGQREAYAGAGGGDWRGDTTPAGAEKDSVLDVAEA